MFAVSYDPVDTLRSFAAEHGITYTLLSDLGSEVIRWLGLINRHVAEQQAFYGKLVSAKHEGLPYPGTFLLDERGAVVDKRFEQSYRVRPSPPALLEDLTGTVLQAADGPTASDVGPGDVTAVAWTHDATYRRLERLRLHVRIEMPADVHVYGQRSAAHYTPLTVHVDSATPIEVGEACLPEDREVELEGLSEVAHVHEGRICTHVDVGAPDDDAPLELTVGIDYQACTVEICHPPARLELPLTLQPHPG